MLPGIKEDESAIFSSFNPKVHSRNLHSSRIDYLDGLKRKLKQLRDGPKIRIPEVLLRHRRSKQAKDAKTQVQGFPTLQDMVEKIKSISLSPEKRKCESSLQMFERLDPRKRPNNKPRCMPHSAGY
jgi:hypothetical protein